jgi:hypothetical protein
MLFGVVTNFIVIILSIMDRLISKRLPIRLF